MDREPVREVAEITNRADASGARLAELLSRPDDQRRREFKYRFAQGVVFGLPVIALQYFGPRLGPADSERWVSLLQALLAGWVLYVNLGMFFEGVVTRRLSGDLLVASIAMLLYAISVISAMAGIIIGRLLYRPLFFHVAVAILILWAGLRWWRVSATPSVRNRE